MVLMVFFCIPVLYYQSCFHEAVSEPGEIMVLQKRALAFYDVFNYVMIIVYLHCLHTMTLKTKQDNVKETKKEIKM